MPNRWQAVPGWECYKVGIGLALCGGKKVSRCTYGIYKYNMRPSEMKVMSHLKNDHDGCILGKDVLDDVFVSVTAYQISLHVI